MKWMDLSWPVHGFHPRTLRYLIFADLLKFLISIAFLNNALLRYTLGKKGCYTPIEDNKTNVDRTVVFVHLAEIGMIWTRDCSPTKFDTTLGRHSMQGQVGSSSSETTI